MFFEKKQAVENQTEQLADKTKDYTVERGDIQAGNSKRAGKKVKTLFLAFGALIALIMGVTSIMALQGGEEEPVKQEDEEVRSTPRSNFAEEMNKLLREAPPPPPVVESTEVLPQTSTASEQPQALTTVIVQQQAPAEPPAPDENELRRLSGNVLAFSGSRQERSNGESGNGSNGSLLNDRMTRAITPSVKAARRADLTYLLRKGTNIACTLHTKIITTQPGFTRCYVNKDVYSANGKVLLIERGSEIIGEQTSGLSQGQARVFVMWHTIETPKGVKIEIDSPSADTLGAAGQEAQVDTHFWERFGGAIMLSMIDDVMGIASNRIDNNDYRFENTQDNIQSMAEEALRNTINIPPTGYVNQGTLLNIIIARDVDFKTVYELVKIN